MTTAAAGTLVFLFDVDNTLFDADRAKRVLDERIRMILRAVRDRALMGPAWQMQSEMLYEAAGQVARALSEGGPPG